MLLTYLVITEALSRSPADEPTHADKVLHEEAYTFVNAVMGNLPASEQHQEELKKRHRANENNCLKVTAGVWVSTFLIWLNTFCCGSPHIHCYGLPLSLDE